MKNKILKNCSYILLMLLIAGGFFACEDNNIDNSIRLDVFGPSPAQRGGEVRFIGNRLNEVTKITLSENIEVSDIQVVSDSEIKITIPEETVSGYVTLKTPEGDIKTKTILGISEPISISKFYKKDSDDNRTVIAGDSIVIEGDYLNLVREVIFTSDISVSLAREDEGEYPRNILTVQVPLQAQTGEITLSDRAEAPTYVISKEVLNVALPEFTSSSHNKVEPEMEITITGVNLQLVKAVKFFPDLSIETPSETNPFTSRSELKVIVPDGVQTGELTLIAYSNVEIEAGKLEVTTPFVSTSLPKRMNVGDKITFEGHNLDKVTAMLFNDVKIDVFEEQTETSISFIITSNVKLGINTLKLVDENDKEYTLRETVELTKLDPIKDDDLMFMDFEKHGEHDPAEWDESWGGVTEFVMEDDNVYLRINKNFGVEQWVINCNHQTSDGTLIPVIDDVTKYVMKVDMKAERDFNIVRPSAEGESLFTFVVTKDWSHKSDKFFPLAEDGITCTTDGGWITVTIDLADFGFTSGSLDLSKSGDTGLFVKTDGMNPTGLCIDNWRFSKK